MLTKEQLDERLNYICGSDCATIMGLNPYSNKVRLWQEKTRQVIAEDISDKPCVKAGNFLEATVRRWFEYETGLTVTEEPNLIVHPIHKWMAGNIDGRINDKEILEIKTTSCDKGWGKQGENKIPDNYLCQITHYMAVTCADICHVAVLIRGVDFRTYIFKRNIELEDLIVAKEQEFWHLVQEEICPEVSTADEVLSLHGYHSIESSIVADYKIQEAIDALNDTKAKMKILEDSKVQLEDKIKVFMQQNDTLVGQDGKIAATWKATTPSKRFDATSFKKDNEAEYEKYLKICSSSRRFSIK